SLARYVFATGCLISAGDFVPWPGPLDGSRDSRLQHLLLASDPRLPPCAQGPLGSVRFPLLLGATADELAAAQAWSVPAIASMLPIVTDMRRGESLFDLHPELREMVRDQQEQHGSGLAAVTCRLMWLDEDGPSGGAAEVTTVSRPHIHVSHEAGLALPDALESRLRKGRHFTLVSAGGGGHAVSLVPSAVRGVVVTEELPYAARG
uniref:START domain-containing protein n=3 Tax=Macrostomum lignano TaxID=282301 RepID=A0A1I8H226_9PLAT